MSGPGKNGYSLIELVVSLALLSVLVMTAAILIEQSLRLFESTGRWAGKPPRKLVFGAVDRPSGTWPSNDGQELAIPRNLTWGSTSQRWMQ